VAHYVQRPEREPSVSRVRKGQPRTLTKDDWRAMYTLMFVLGRAVVERGVDSLPPEVRRLLLEGLP
jgi:hypothetical protein